MIDYDFNVKNVKDLGYVNMIEYEVIAKNVRAHKSVSMIENDDIAKNVRALKYVNMINKKDSVGNATPNQIISVFEDMKMVFGASRVKWLNTTITASPVSLNSSLMIQDQRLLILPVKNSRFSDI